MRESRIDEAARDARRIVEAVAGVVRGKEAQAELAVTALLAGGHLLIEDTPGVGKTTLARALAHSLGMPFRRVQFTSDMMPADLLGGNIFDPSTASFHFRPGPIFTSLLLADEINRTTPKTQSALLEAMEEGQVSLDGETRPLPSDFFVVATQNPLDFEGTYPLPESQLDRFSLRIELGPPPVEIERELLLGRGADDPLAGVQAVISGERLAAAKEAAHQVRVEPPVLDYLHSIVIATREAKTLHHGASTRAALIYMRAIRARALVFGRDYALPDDVKALALPVLSHRLRLRNAPIGTNHQREEVDRALRALLEALPIPR